MCEDCVCAQDALCCELSWGESCTALAADSCSETCGCASPGKNPGDGGSPEFGGTPAGEDGADETGTSTGSGEPTSGDPEDVPEEDDGLGPIGGEETCGNGTCGSGEDCSTCAVDCGICCGDGTCSESAGETCGSCFEDCGACPFCGDGECNGGEDNLTCAGDCGIDVAFCGDGTCGEGENCEACDVDCGVCPDDDNTEEGGSSEEGGSESPPINCEDGFAICVVDIDGEIDPCEECPEVCCPGVCGNGICEEGFDENCDTCGDDCDCGTPCGDGVCDGNEDCATCASDCGECPSCGDGQCSESDGEDCTTCSDDCGDCQCIDFDTMDFSESESFSEEVESPKVVGTGVDLTVSGSISASGSIGEDGCSLSSEAGGSIEACGKILYNGVCVSGSVDTSLGCTMELMCNPPPLFQCDPNTMCCTGSLTGSLMIQRTWEIEKGFGPAQCEFYVKAGIGGKGNITDKEGPGCDCEGGKVSVQADLSGSGGGGCKVSLFGLGLEASGDVTAGACGGRVFAVGNCSGGGNWISGAYVAVQIGPVSFGWFGSYEYSKKWTAGDDC